MLYIISENSDLAEANEEKRQKYQELIQDIPNTNLVYIDESGIDTIICKDRGWGKKSEKLVGKKSGKSYQRTNIELLI